MVMRVLMVWMLLAVGLQTRAGDYLFRHLTSEQGLPHQQVEAIVQDAVGNIWIGTRNGLACYDGYEIKNFYHSETDSTSISHNFVHRLFLDSRGRLWVVTSGGVCRYVAATDSFRCYDVQGSVSTMVETRGGRILCAGDNLYAYDSQADTFVTWPAPRGFVLSMAVDAADNIYIATNNSLFRYDATLTRISYPFGNMCADFLTGADGIVPMLFDHKGALWIGRNGKGVMRIDAAGTSMVFGPSDISDGIVRTIAEDSHHNIWLGTEKGLTVISPNGEVECIRSSFSDSNTLSDNAIYAIFCDRNENLWVGSYFGGVDILYHKSEQFGHFRPGNASTDIHGKVARTMVQTDDNTYWIATEDGGLNIYNAATGHFDRFGGIPQLGSNVHSLYYDRAVHTMWIGTFRNGLFRYNLSTGAARQYLMSNGHNLNSVFAITKQRSGKLWVATTQGLFSYDEQADAFNATGNRILDNYFVYCLCCDHNDNLWCGTAAFGLFLIDAKSGKITTWNTNNTQLLDNYVTYIFEDSHHRLWLGTNNNGVQYLDPDRKQIGVLSHSTMLQKSCICAINEDADGFLWISTSMGLLRYSHADNTMVRFTTEDGLPTNQFNFSSTLMASTGKMFFGTVNGLVHFVPSAILPRGSQLAVHLKALTVYNQIVKAGDDGSPLKMNIDAAEEITLSYSQAKSFSIEYGVIEPGNNNSVEYQILLEGVDKTWRDMGKERKFSGFNLTPGTYMLHIRANNSREEWDKCQVRSIKIIVRPPFYKTFWAYAIYLLLLAGGAVVAYRVATSRLRRRQATKIAQVEQEQRKQLDQAKLEFFTSVSHEIKTPLSLIAAPLKVLASQPMCAEWRKNLDIAIKNTRKMDSLINELVTFNKLETDQFPFYIQRGNPLDFIAINVQSFRDLAQDKQLQLTADSENNGEEVWFSPSYVEHIINNLLSNAIKFTPGGGKVSVKAAIVADETDGYDYLKIVVSDTGIGIAPEEQQNIFGRYYQTKRGYNVNNSGWGIGLSLVKRLTDVHRGDIHLVSQPGKGSSFTVLLNVSEGAFPPSTYITDDKVIVPISEYKFSPSMTDLATDVDTDYADGLPTQGRMTLLIVDDNDDLLAFLSSYFSREYNVLAAHNGQEALHMAHTENIQLVVSDIMMPGMSGIELCRTLKTDMATSHIPVILLTAKSLPDDVVEGYKSGAESYVSKPFEPQILELQIKNILALQRDRQKEIANSTETDVAASSLTVLDQKFIRDFNALVEENISNSDFSVSHITAHLGVSRSLLHTKMRSLMNMSTGDYIRKKRLDYACQVLLQTHSVAETAYKSGFSDPNYFSKVFKKFMGISPTEYISNPKPPTS